MTNRISIMQIVATLRHIGFHFERHYPAIVLLLKGIFTDGYVDGYVLLFTTMIRYMSQFS